MFRWAGGCSSGSGGIEFDVAVVEQAGGGCVRVVVAEVVRRDGFARLDRFGVALMGPSGCSHDAEPLRESPLNCAGSPVGKRDGRAGGEWPEGNPDGSDAAIVHPISGLRVWHTRQASVRETGVFTRRTASISRLRTVST